MLHFYVLCNKQCFISEGSPWQWKLSPSEATATEGLLYHHFVFSSNQQYHLYNPSVTASCATSLCWGEAGNVCTVLMVIFYHV